MRPQMESLESRSLLSAASSLTLIADLSKLGTDAAALKAQFQQYAPTLRADLQMLRADVRAAGLAGHGLLLSSLNAASLRFYAVTKADAFRLIAVDSAAARRGFVDALRLMVHPNNVRLQAKVQADVTAFNTATNAVVNKLGADGAALSSASAAALGAIGAAYSGNATIAADIAKIQSDGSAFITGITPPLQAVQADLSQFLTDLTAG
jgi:hypothetical protein